MPILAPSSRPALLALSNGKVFRGLAIGAAGTTTGEITFHTVMTGYQEILSAPASYGQIVTITYPMVGNTGINEEDFESDQIWANGLVIKQLPAKASNWRKTQELPAYLEQAGIVGIEGVDTREITNIVREEGILGACIIAAEYPGDVLDEKHAIEQAKEALNITDQDLTGKVSTDHVYEWTIGAWDFSGFNHPKQDKGHLCVIDLGLKKSLLSAFSERGYKITVLPASTSFDEIMKLNPDGVIFSDGPGEASKCTQVINTAKTLIQQNIPLFGIGIGHQILALAEGARLQKLKAGHHSASNPVHFKRLGYFSMSQQNQRYMIDINSLPSHLLVDQISLFDQSLQGLCWENRPIMTSQGYPDTLSAPMIPQPSVHVFDRFLSLIK